MRAFYGHFVFAVTLVTIVPLESFCSCCGSELAAVVTLRKDELQTFQRDLSSLRGGVGGLLFYTGDGILRFSCEARQTEG